MTNQKTTENEMSKFVQVLRWLAVLPGAFFCAFLVTFPIHWLVKVFQFFRSTNSDAGITIDGKNPIALIPPEFLERFGYAFFIPLVIIIVAAWIAPKFPFRTGVLFAVLWGVIFGANVVMAITGGPHTGSTWFRYSIGCLLGIAGTASGLYLIYEPRKP